MARVAIVGVGAIGASIAAQLETTGLHEITLCTRRPLLRLTVKTPDRVVSMQPRNLVDPERADVVDWVLVATKTYDAEGAAAWLRRLCGARTPVAILQNGVEHCELFGAYMDRKSILPVVVNCPAERRDDGTVEQRGTAELQVEQGPMGSEFAELFTGSKVKVELMDDFLTAAWRKLCLNAAGVVSALVMQPAGVFRDEALAQVALDIVAECAAVGRAEGARLEDDIGRQVVERYRAQPPDSINSLLADRLGGRPMEVDARNGVIVRKGAKHGIPTPANRMAMAVLQRMSGAHASQPAQALQK